MREDSYGPRGSQEMLFWKLLRNFGGWARNNSVDLFTMSVGHVLISLG